MNLMMDNFDIYVASCTETGGIYHYKMQDGVLDFVDITRIDRPMYMVIAENRMYILLREAFDNKESGLVMYDIDENGKLVNPSDILSTKGEVACHLMVDGSNVYCTNYISGSVIKMPDALAVHSGHSIHQKRQKTPHPHYVCASPDNQFIFVTDLGLDKIFIYNKDLAVHSVTDMPAGHGPRHLVCHSDGRTIFCANELNSTVSVLEYENGILKLKDTVSALPEKYDNKSTIAAIRCENDRIYVSNRGHDSVSVMTYDGKLTLEKTISCGGKEPRDIWVNESLVICANQTSGNVVAISKENDTILFEFVIEQAVGIIVY